MFTANRTNVYLITGFLGSGKTTFLNRLIKAFPRDRKLMILMNEFGEIGIDGRLVEDQDLAMLEINKGSIFCVCVKTDFIRGLSKIAGVIRPDVLFIEATGVANPSDLRRDLKLSVFKDRFCFQEQFCLIDAENFSSAYETFTSVEKQIESSSVFVINKTDLASAEDVCRIREIVARHHADPRFFQTTFADLPLDRFLPGVIQPDPAQPEHLEVWSEQQVEASIEALLDDPRGAVTPPDLLASAVYAWCGEDLPSFRRWADELPVRLVRAKGFLRHEGALLLFSWVMGKWELKPAPTVVAGNDGVNKIVFIAHPRVLEQLQLAAKDNPSLAHLSSFDAMAVNAVSAKPLD